MIVRVSTTLPTSLERAWNSVKHGSSFLYVTRGFLGLANATQFQQTLSEGNTFQTYLYVFHIIPFGSHVLRIVRLDEEAHEIYSNESGQLIRVWNHLIKLEAETTTSCKYTDEIELQAGWLTPLVGVFAPLFYCYRQYRWRKLARTL